VSLALLLLAALEPSPVAIGSHLILGADLRQEVGELPSFAPAREFDRYAGWIHLRGGIVDSQPNTQLGTQLGFEFDVRVGFTPNEAEEVHESIPLGFIANAGLAMRAFTFNEPFLGMLVPHLSLEFGAGGGHWWSDTPRLSVIGGLRGAIGTTGGLSMEADYTVAPFVISGAPGDLTVKHVEHRVAIGIGAGSIGVAVWLRFSRQRWRLTEEDDFATTTGRSLGVGLEWRP
jgi:hypothetical protein